MDISGSLTIIWSKLQEVVHFAVFTYRNYVADGCRQRAGSLTYLSLFAVVPMLTVFFTVLSLVPAFTSLGTDIQDWILNNLLPAAGEEAKIALEGFAKQARTLTAVGIAFLVTTAYFMLKNIEQTFNSIWHTRTNRKGLANFLLYWAILSLGPLLIGLGFVISTYLLSLGIMIDEVDSTGITRELLALAPFFLEAATFTLLFKAVPNTAVPLKHAAYGGFITAVAFEIAKYSFTLIVKHTSFTLIYGAFAAVPLFLLWIFIGWQIVLGGAEFVHALGSYQPHTARRYHPLIVTVGLLDLFHKRQRQGKTVTDSDIQSSPWLLDRQKLPTRQWQNLRNAMLSSKLIHTTDEGHYVLGKDLNSLSLWELAGLIPGAWRPLDNDGFEPKPIHRTEPVAAWYNRTRGLLLDIDTTRKNAMGESIAQLINPDEVSPETPCVSSLPSSPSA